MISHRSSDIYGGVSAAVGVAPAGVEDHHRVPMMFRFLGLGVASCPAWLRFGARSRGLSSVRAVGLAPPLFAALQEQLSRPPRFLLGGVVPGQYPHCIAAREISLVMAWWSAHMAHDPARASAFEAASWSKACSCRPPTHRFCAVVLLWEVGVGGYNRGVVSKRFRGLGMEDREE